MKNGKRDYKRENELYNSKPEQKKKRAARNAARATMMKAGKVHKGDNLDVDHSKALSKGGTNSPSNLVAISLAANRSFKRDSKSRMVSQKSKRESKRK
jgi:hypothetical protein